MSTPSNSLLQDVLAAINAPSLSRNIRGQVRAGLGCLPLSWQKLLACDFAEHAIRLFLAEDSRRLQGTLNGINSIRSFLKGTISLEIMDKILDIAAETHREGTYTYIINDVICEGIISNDSESLLGLVTSCCCQREYEEAGLIFRNRYQPDAAGVAMEACAAVYRHYTSSHDKSAALIDSSKIQSEARRMSDVEAEYQRDHLVQYVRERPAGEEK